MKAMLAKSSSAADNGRRAPSAITHEPARRIIGGRRGDVLGDGRRNQRLGGMVLAAMALGGRKYCHGGPGRKIRASIRR